MLECFLSWRNFVSRRRWCTKVLCHRRRTARVQLLHSTLTLWQDTTRTLRRLRFAASRVVRHVAVGVLVGTFVHWKSTVVARREVLKSQDNFRRAKEKQELSELFSSWAGAVHKRVAIRGRVAMLLSRSEARLARRCFVSWRVELESKIAASCFLGHLQYKLKRKTLQTWVAAVLLAGNTEKLTSLSQVVLRRDFLRNVWFLWVYLTKRKALSVCSLKQRIGVRMSARSVRVAFQAWKASSRVSGQALLESRRRFEEKLSKCCTRTFNWWKACTEEKKQNREKLRMCIASKRMACDWFMNWYASVFEAEISSAVDLLFGTCDDSIRHLFQEENCPWPGRQAEHGLEGPVESKSPEIRVSERFEADTVSCARAIYYPRDLSMALSCNASLFTTSCESGESRELWTPAKTPSLRSSAGLGSDSGIIPSYGNPLYNSTSPGKRECNFSPVQPSPNPAYLPASARQTKGSQLPENSTPGCQNPAHSPFEPSVPSCFKARGVMEGLQQTGRETLPLSAVSGCVPSPQLG
uniref:Sfi1 spindle body domain-containing protein n=1 Tax=Tetraselmis sp. GSL018 TaxID=582737 RepID=A0A061SFK8_9CHLO